MLIFTFDPFDALNIVEKGLDDEVLHEDGVGGAESVLRGEDDRSILVDGGVDAVAEIVFVLACHRITGTELQDAVFLAMRVLSFS